MALKSSTARTVLSQEKEGQVEDFRTQFMEAVNDDLNTPKALAVLWEALKSNIPSEDKYDLAMTFDEILGLRLSEAKTAEADMPPEIKELISKRNTLRKEKKFEEADKIRKQIEEAGYSVNDTSL